MKPTDIDASEREKILKKYAQNRELGRTLFKDMVKYIPGGGLVKAAKKLGLTSGKRIVLATEEEQSVLADYAFFNEFSGQMNAIDRYVNMNKPFAQDESDFFADMQRSFFSIFRLTSKLPGFGFGVEDLMTGDRYCIVDVNFSNTNNSPTFMTGRVAWFADNCFCSTGSFIPLLDSSTTERVEQIANKYLRHAKSDGQPIFSMKQSAAFQADVQKILLKSMSLEGIVYE